MNTVNVDAKNNNCMSAIIKNYYGYNYGTKEYYEIADLIAKENPEIFNTGRKTLNNSKKADETFLYVGDKISLPAINSKENEVTQEILNTIEEENVNSYDNLLKQYTTQKGDYLWKIADATKDFDETVTDSMVEIVMLNPEKYGIFTEQELDNFNWQDWNELSWEFPNTEGEILNIDTQKESFENYPVQENKKTEQDCLKQFGLYVNKIIETSKQKITNGVALDGDCWALSGLNALSYSETGAKLIKDAMTIKEDGTIDIYFKGINETYTITSDEMEEYNENRFTGDDDVMAFEIALIKYRNDLLNGKKFNKNPYVNSKGLAYNGRELYGGSSATIFNLITDERINENWPITKGEASETLSKFEKANDAICTFSVVEGKGNEVLKINLKGANNQNITFFKNHAYAIKKADNQTVTIIDPLDSSKEIVLNKDDFLNLMETGIGTMIYHEFN